MKLETRSGITLLDGLIHDGLKNDPDELARARMVAGATALLIVTSFSMAALSPWMGATVVEGFSYLACSIPYLTALFLLRRRGALGRATMTVAFVLAFIMVGLAAQEGGAYLVLSPWNALLPLFVGYTLGGRTGVVFTGLFCAALGVTWMMQEAGFTLTLGRTPPLSTVTTFVGLAGLLLVAAYVWWFRASYDRARAQLQSMVDALDGEQRKLTSVLESTEDAILSLDARHRLIHINTSARELIGRRTVAPMVTGIELTEILPALGGPRWRAHLDEARDHGSVRVEVVWSTPEGEHDRELELVITRTGSSHCDGYTIYARDVTDRKAHERRIASMHRQLVDLSRRAGMADVATNVLHNAGNVLTSMVLSCERLSSGMSGSMASDLGRALSLLPSRPENIGKFLCEDPKGVNVVPYLRELGDAMVQQGLRNQEDLKGLELGLEHMSQVIWAQQDLARAHAPLETLAVAELVETAVQVTRVKMTESIDFVMEYAEPDLVLVSDRHKVVLILANLLSNARHAVMQVEKPQVRIRVSRRDEFLRFEVIDNGVGIPPYQISNIFQRGFTTKSDGHGFGLHSAANDASQLGGRLRVHSDGVGRGSTFVLKIPATATVGVDPHPERAPGSSGLADAGKVA